MIILPFFGSTNSSTKYANKTKNMNESKIQLFNLVQEIYHETGQPCHQHSAQFNNPEEKALCKHAGKRRKCCLPAVSPFPTVFSCLPKTNFNI